MDSQRIHMEFPVKGGDFNSAGDAAGKVKNILKLLGVRPDIIKRVAIASYEAEMNIVIYARDGKLLADIEPDGISIAAQDRGPGIPDIGKAMEEGYSTATSSIRELGFGAGMGLPNIKRASDWMSIESEPGKGTAVRFKISFNGDSNDGAAG